MSHIRAVYGEFDKLLINVIISRRIFVSASITRKRKGFEMNEYPGWTSETLIQQALSDLVNTKEVEKAFDKAYTHECTRLDRHPFGLPLPKKKRGPFDPAEVAFLGCQGHTDESVQSMLAYIRYFIAKQAPMYTTPRYMRIIYAPMETGSGHYVYFEMSGWSGTFMCGGCTDCSGAGNNGRRMLESVFRLFSLIYGVDVDEVVVSRETAIAGHDYIQAEYEHAVAA